MLSFQANSSQRIQCCFQVSKQRQCWSRRSYQERLHLRRLKRNLWKQSVQTNTSFNQERADEQN